MNYRLTKLCSLSLFSGVLLLNVANSNIARASELEPSNNSAQLAFPEKLSSQNIIASDSKARAIALTNEQPIVETEIPVVTLEESEFVDNNYFSNTENQDNTLTLFVIEF